MGQGLQVRIHVAHIIEKIQEAAQSISNDQEQYDKKPIARPYRQRSGDNDEMKGEDMQNTEGDHDLNQIHKPYDAI
jgi:hypothetical protein